MSWAEDEGYDIYDGLEDNIPSIDFTDGEWTDADGNTHQIKTMDVRYIKNCIAVLKRTQEKWDYPKEDLREIKYKIREFESELNRRSQPTTPGEF